MSRITLFDGNLKIGNPVDNYVYFGDFIAPTRCFFGTNILFEQ
jgi:hypothetical protein